MYYTDKSLTKEIWMYWIYETAFSDVLSDKLTHQITA